MMMCRCRVRRRVPIVCSRISVVADAETDFGRLTARLEAAPFQNPQRAKPRPFKPKRKSDLFRSFRRHALRNKSQTEALLPFRPGCIEPAKYRKLSSWGSYGSHEEAGCAALVAVMKIRRLTAFA